MKIIVSIVIAGVLPLAGLSLAVGQTSTGAASVAQEKAAMTVEQARQASLAGELILVDIRTAQEWRESGVPDVAVPLDMTQRGFLDKLMALRKDRPQARIGLICATGGRSDYLARALLKHGLSNIVDVPAGVHSRNGWLAKKLPLKKLTGSESGTR